MFRPLSLVLTFSLPSDISLSDKFKREYSTLWRSIFVLDIPKIEETALAWGITFDSDMCVSCLPSVEVDELSSDASPPFFPQVRLLRPPPSNPSSLVEARAKECCYSSPREFNRVRAAAGDQRVSSTSTLLLSSSSSFEHQRRRQLTPPFYFSVA